MTRCLGCAANGRAPSHERSRWLVVGVSLGVLVVAGGAVPPILTSPCEEQSGLARTNKAVAAVDPADRSVIAAAGIFESCPGLPPDLAEAMNALPHVGTSERATIAAAAIASPAGKALWASACPGNPSVAGDFRAAFRACGFARLDFAEEDEYAALTGNPKLCREMSLFAPALFAWMVGKGVDRTLARDATRALAGLPIPIRAEVRPGLQPPRVSFGRDIEVGVALEVSASEVRVDGERVATLSGGSVRPEELARLKETLDRRVKDEETRRDALEKAQPSKKKFPIVLAGTKRPGSPEEAPSRPDCQRARRSSARLMAVAHEGTRWGTLRPILLAAQLNPHLVGLDARTAEFASIAVSTVSACKAGNFPALAITADAFRFSDGTGGKARLARAPGELRLCRTAGADAPSKDCDEGTLLAALAKAKSSQPDQRTIAITCDDGVAFGDLLRVIDAVQLRDSLNQPVLFPDVELSLDALPAAETSAAAKTRPADSGQGLGQPRKPDVAAGPEDLVVQGLLDKEAIRKVIERNLPQVRSCYESGLQIRPSLADKVVVRLIIAPNGEVQTAQIVGGTTLAELGNCILARLRGWKFPSPSGSGSVIVTYPFVFSQAGK